MLNRDEKIGGFPVTYSNVEDFKNCIESCHMLQVQYKGSLFIWWNGRWGLTIFFRGWIELWFHLIFRIYFHVDKSSIIQRWIG